MGELLSNARDAYIRALEARVELYHGTECNEHYTELFRLAPHLREGISEVHKERRVLNISELQRGSLELVESLLTLLPEHVDYSETFWIDYMTKKVPMKRKIVDHHKLYIEVDGELQDYHEIKLMTTEPHEGNFIEVGIYLHREFPAATQVYFGSERNSLGGDCLSNREIVINFSSVEIDSLRRYEKGESYDMKSFLDDIIREYSS